MSPPGTWLMKMDCGRSQDVAPLDVGGAPLEAAEREEALPKRRERKEQFGGLVQLEGLKSKRVNDVWPGIGHVVILWV
jgi:hypothetical protein